MMVKSSFSLLAEQNSVSCLLSPLFLPDKGASFLPLPRTDFILLLSFQLLVQQSDLVLLLLLIFLPYSFLPFLEYLQPLGPLSWLSLASLCLCSKTPDQLQKLQQL